jgi:hypothetical protein
MRRIGELEDELKNVMRTIDEQRAEIAAQAKTIDDQATSLRVGALRLIGGKMRSTWSRTTRVSGFGLAKDGSQTSKPKAS